MDDLKNLVNAMLHVFKTLNLEQKKFVATLVMAAGGFFRIGAWLSIHVLKF